MLRVPLDDCYATRVSCSYTRRSSQGDRTDDHDHAGRDRGSLRTLRARAESYASDARRFRDAAKLGNPIISGEHDTRWATVYSVVADELRKCADAIRAETTRPYDGTTAGGALAERSHRRRG